MEVEERVVDAAVAGMHKRCRRHKDKEKEPI